MAQPNPPQQPKPRSDLLDDWEARKSAFKRDLEAIQEKHQIALEVQPPEQWNLAMKDLKKLQANKPVRIPSAK